MYKDKMLRRVCCRQSVMLSLMITSQLQTQPPHILPSFCLLSILTSLWGQVVIWLSQFPLVSSDATSQGGYPALEYHSLWQCFTPTVFFDDDVLSAGQSTRYKGTIPRAPVTASSDNVSSQFRLTSISIFQGVSPSSQPSPTMSYRSLSHRRSSSMQFRAAVQG